MTRLRSLLAAGSVALIAGLGVPSLAGAQCFYDDIAAGSTYSFSNGGTPRINQVNNYWTAIAVAPPSTDDWDIGVYSTTAAFPTCVTGLLANSVLGGNVVDFVIGDFNANTPGTYLAKVNRFSGVGATAFTQWDSGADVLTVNDYPTTRTVAPINVVECWDVLLEAGKDYRFSITHAGSAALKVLVFRNPSASPYWAGRSARVLETATNATYTAPSTAWYGVVVVNDNGGSDTYQVAVGTCETPLALASGVASPAYGFSAWRSFNQTAGYYTAVAVRSDDVTQDWDLDVYAGASGGAYPACFSTFLANSALGSGRTDFVVGDFNGGANPIGTYYARANPYGSTTSTAKIEWDSGSDVLGVDAAPVTRATGPDDLIECWDVRLNGGQNYGINFTHDGAADLKVMIFLNPGAGYWAGRSAASYVATGNGNFTAPTLDWYTILVVNDNGQPGNYKLGVAQCAGMFSLASGGIYFSTPGSGYEIHPTAPAWTVYGALNSPDGTPGNWDAQMYRDGTGGAFPWCASTLLGSSTLAGGKVDFIAGDFHVNAPGYFYPQPVQNLGASNNVKTSWDGGAEVIAVDDPPVDRSLFQYALLESWDVFLNAGQAYTFKFNVASGDLHLSLMRNPGVSPYWAGRATAEFDLPSGEHPYVAPTTGWYGAVVTNEKTDIAGAFTLGVYTGAVAVEPGAGMTTRFASAVPNPARSGVTFGYELREPAAVDFEVRDVAGRLVAHIPAGRHEVGRGSLVWNGLSTGGARVAAGIYFVRMNVAGRTAGNATVVML